MTHSITLKACCLTFLLALQSLPALAQEYMDNSNVMVAPLSPPEDPNMQMQPMPMQPMPMEPMPMEVSEPPSIQGIPRPNKLSELSQGTWSYDVMKIARASGCDGDGAWLIGKKGMEETYQVFCPTDRQFLAVCVRAGCIEIVD